MACRGSYIGLMRHLRISPGGRLANQMIQFMIAKKLQKLVPGLVIHGYDLPRWRLSAPSPAHLRVAGPELTGNLFDVRHVAGLMNAGWIDGAHLTGFSLNMSNFGSREECSELFQPPSESPPGFGKDELVIHVRGEDILTGGHPDYGPLPIQFYVRIVAQTGLRPVFLGQIQEGRYLDEIRRAFPDAQILPARDVLADFQTMRNSKNIVLGLSSFSWLAAWFSDADRIHLPVFGFLNPRQRPDIHCLPVDDSRYSFYLLPVRKWNAGPDDQAALYDQRLPIEPIAAGEAGRLLRRGAWRIAPKRLAKRVLLTAQCARAKWAVGAPGRTGPTGAP